MNDLTIEELNKDEEVFFYLKPSEKIPHCITKVLWAEYDERGRGWVGLNGVGEVPVYHVKKMPEDSSLIKLYSDGIKDKIKIDLLPGIDF